MTAESSPAAADSARAIVDRYEQLRCEALGKPDASRGHGLVLFMARGMVAWMQAWSCCIAQPRTPENTDAVRASSSGLNAEMTRLLASMALAAVAEVSA